MLPGWHDDNGGAFFTPLVPRETLLLQLLLSAERHFAGVLQATGADRGRLRAHTAPGQNYRHPRTSLASRLKAGAGARERHKRRAAAAGEGEAAGAKQGSCRGPGHVTRGLRQGGGGQGRHRLKATATRPSKLCPSAWAGSGTRQQRLQAGLLGRKAGAQQRARGGAASLRFERAARLSFLNAPRALKDCVLDCEPFGGRNS